jgi:chemotaxis protein CheD
MEGLEKIYVQEGQFVVSEKPTELITILGSCVAVCLWDKKTKTGGMNHFLLPLSSGSQASVGLTSTKLLIQSMIKKVYGIRNLEAKIFGGANKFFSNSFLVVGPHNVNAAKTILKGAGIPIVLEDTGGEAGRKIFFDTTTGKVTVDLIT